MKKIIALMLAACLLCATLVLVSCKNEESGDLTNIDDYVAPSYKKDIGTGIITYADGIGETAVITNYEPKIHEPHDVVIPEKVGQSDDRNVTIIGAEAFKACTSLKSVTIPETVTVIESAAFYGCDNLVEIEIPTAVKTIGELAFANCTKLQKVKTEDTSSLATIGKNAFDGCVELVKFELPEKLVTIEAGAFRNCAKLQKVVIPESVKTIGEHAYVGCDALNYDGCITLTATIDDLGGFDPDGDALVIVFTTNKEYIDAPEGSYAAAFVAAMRDTSAE